MTKLKSRPTIDITNSLVDNLPETTTLKELKNIRATLATECSRIAKGIYYPQPSDDLPVEEEKSISPPIKSPTEPIIKPVKIPISVTLSMDKDQLNLIEFINFNMTNCAQFSKESVISGLFTVEYLKYRKLSNPEPISKQQLTALMNSIGIEKFKNWEHERWSGIKFVNPSLCEPKKKTDK